MNFSDQHFSDDLMERCKSVSGEVTGTRAVRSTLQKFFEMEQEYRALKLKYNDLEADFNELFRALETLRKFEAGKFRLHSS